MRTCLCLLLALIFATPVHAQNSDIQLIKKLPPELNWVLFDTRATKQCLARSLKGARCLAAKDILSPRRHFPSLRDITWLLGSFGLTGEETVIVAGNPGLEKDFVAGMFYLAGQKKVLLLNSPLGRLIASPKHESSPGRARAMSRETIYTAHPRAKQIIMRQELWDLINSDKPLRLLDARSEAEYWGQQIRGWRGGHIPGAELWDKTQAQVNIPTKLAVETVFYAHDPFETIARFAQIQSRAEKTIRVFIEGWRSWSINGSLTADAESFYDSTRQLKAQN